MRTAFFNSLESLTEEILLKQGRLIMDGILGNFPFTVIITFILVLLGLILLYYILLVRSILDMLRRDIQQTVLLTFAFLSLIFSPFTLIMGINVIIIWAIYRKSLS